MRMTSKCYEGNRLAHLSKKRVIAWRNNIIRINMAIHPDKWTTRRQVCCNSTCCLKGENSIDQQNFNFN